MHTSVEAGLPGSLDDMMQFTRGTYSSGSFTLNITEVAFTISSCIYLF